MGQQSAATRIDPTLYRLCMEPRTFLHHQLRSILTECDSQQYVNSWKSLYANFLKLKLKKVHLGMILQIWKCMMMKRIMHTAFLCHSMLATNHFMRESRKTTCLLRSRHATLKSVEFASQQPVGNSCNTMGKSQWYDDTSFYWIFGIVPYDDHLRSSLDPNSGTPNLFWHNDCAVQRMHIHSLLPCYFSFLLYTRYNIYTYIYMRRRRRRPSPPPPQFN